MRQDRDQRKTSTDWVADGSSVVLSKALGDASYNRLEYDCEPQKWCPHSTSTMSTFTFTSPQGRSQAGRLGGGSVAKGPLSFGGPFISMLYIIQSSYTSILSLNEEAHETEMR